MMNGLGVDDCSDHNGSRVVEQGVMNYDGVIGGGSIVVEEMSVFRMMVLEKHKMRRIVCDF